MGCQSAGAGWILCACADNNRYSGLHQSLNAFHALLVCQQGPVPHGSAIDNSGHTVFDEFLAHFDKGIKIRCPVCFARCHQGGHDALENGGGHQIVSFATQNDDLVFMRAKLNELAHLSMKDPQWAQDFHDIMIETSRNRLEKPHPSTESDGDPQSFLGATCQRRGGMKRRVA